MNDQHSRLLSGSVAKRMLIASAFTALKNGNVKESFNDSSVDKQMAIDAMSDRCYELYAFTYAYNTFNLSQSVINDLRDQRARMGGVADALSSDAIPLLGAADAYLDIEEAVSNIQAPHTDDDQYVIAGRAAASMICNEDTRKQYDSMLAQ